MRTEVLACKDTLKIIEIYPDDRYLPAGLFLGWTGRCHVHLVVAFDVPGDNIRIVTFAA